MGWFRVPLLALCVAAGCVFAGSVAAMPPVAQVVSAAGQSLVRTPLAAQQPAVAWQDVEALRADIQARLAREPARPACAAAVASVQRSIVAGDIAHYVMTVRTGPGTYDVIRVHRVVRESRRGQPIRTPLNVFLQHGDAKDFTGMFLPGLYSPATPDDFGFAVFAARCGVDVWGIDQAWTVMPQDLPDYGFMKTWGMDRQVRDLEIAMTIARLGRLATGSGGGKMILGGYSSGVFTTLALLDAETQRPPLLRNACGWIAVDLAFRTDNAELLAAVEAEYAAYQALWDAGEYGYFVPFRLLSELTRCCPGDESPLIPGFTNEQVAFYFSTAVMYPPVFHYWAGDFDEDGMPTGPVLVERELWLDFLGSAPVYEPQKFMMDCDAMWLDRSSYDDHLGQITVPVFNVSPHGGFGELTLHGIAMLGSADVQSLFPSIGTTPELDMGHIDIWTWEGARERMWQPIVEWIAAHTGAPPGAPRMLPLAQGVEVGTSDAAPAIESVTPNPAHGGFRASLSLAGSEPVRLQVVDVAGRTVWSREVVGAGRHQVEIGGDRPLAPGVYLLHAAQGSLSSTRRVAVVR